MPWMGSDIDPSLSCPPDLPGIFSVRSGASGLLGYRYGIPGSTGVCRAICSVTEREIPGTGYYA